eukprot:2500518-Prymnesium_polylepis.1
MAAEIAAARADNGELACQLDHVYGRLRELVAPSGQELTLDDCTSAAAIVLREAIAELAATLEHRQQQPGASAAGTSERAAASDAEDPGASTGAAERGDSADPLASWLVEGP